jgi:hypothetical protein
LAGTKTAENPIVIVKVKERALQAEKLINKALDDGYLTRKEYAQIAKTHLEVKDLLRRNHPFYGNAEWGKEKIQELVDKYSTLLFGVIPENEKNGNITLEANIEILENEKPRSTGWVPTNVLLTELKVKSEDSYKQVVEAYGKTHGTTFRGKDAETVLTGLVTLAEYFGTEGRKVTSELLDEVEVTKYNLRAASPSGAKIKVSDELKEKVGYKSKDKQ